MKRLIPTVLLLAVSLMLPGSRPGSMVYAEAGVAPTGSQTCWDVKKASHDSDIAAFSSKDEVAVPTAPTLFGVERDDDMTAKTPTSPSARSHECDSPDALSGYRKLCRWRLTTEQIQRVACVMDRIRTELAYID